MMLRMVKILLIVSVAMWATLGVFGNFNDWSGTTGAVGAATSMSTFEGGTEDWRATTNPVLIMVGAIFIILFKLGTALLCFVGAWHMWSARAANQATFNSAKSYALAGCGVAMFMLFTGWIVVAETWFEMWRSDVLRGTALDSAFRYCGMIGVISLFVGASEK